MVAIRADFHHEIKIRIFNKPTDFILSSCQVHVICLVIIDQRRHCCCSGFSGKYVQCPQGILPLRKFFCGGREDATGRTRSWEAIRAKLQQIIDEEDKTKPLSDDQIRMRLKEAGIESLARRTVAKYRKLMDIPAARFRKKY